MKVVRLLALRSGRLYPQDTFLAESTAGHSVAGSIMLKKNLNNTIGNRTLDLPASNAVPQLNTQLRGPNQAYTWDK